MIRLAIEEYHVNWGWLFVRQVAVNLKASYGSISPFASHIVLREENRKNRIEEYPLDGEMRRVGPEFSLVVKELLFLIGFEDLSGDYPIPTIYPFSHPVNDRTCSKDSMGSHLD